MQMPCFIWVGVITILRNGLGTGKRPFSYIAKWAIKLHWRTCSACWGNSEFCTEILSWAKNVWMRRCVYGKPTGGQIFGITSGHKKRDCSDERRIRTGGDSAEGRHDIRPGKRESYVLSLGAGPSGTRPVAFGQSDG